MSKVANIFLSFKQKPQMRKLARTKKVSAVIERKEERNKKGGGKLPKKKTDSRTNSTESVTTFLFYFILLLLIISIILKCSNNQGRNKEDAGITYTSSPSNSHTNLFSMRVS
jgi:hypothetical protein